MNYPNEARIFVRHNDGSQLVVPEQHGEITRLSFSVEIPADHEPLKYIEDKQKETDSDLGFFYLQHHLGREELYQLTPADVSVQQIYGYLGQTYLPSLQEGRNTLSIDDAREIIDTSRHIDGPEYELAQAAFKRITAFQAR